MLSRCTMHFPVVVLYELLDESTVLIQDLVAHVGDVVQDCFIFNHEIFLSGGPSVHRRYWIDRVYDAYWSLLGCYNTISCGQFFGMLMILHRV